MNISTDLIESQGFDKARLDHLKRSIEADIEKGVYGGASMVVTRNDETVFDESLGFADASRTLPVSHRQLFCTMSVAKQLTLVALLQRIERGEAAFTDLVADHVPEYGCRGKERTIISDLLTQRSGLPNGLPTLPPDKLGDLEANVAAYCMAVPEIEPGTAVNYSYFGNHAIIAEIVRRLDGGSRRFREIVKSDLLEPLGMTDTTLGLPEDKQGQQAEMYAAFEKAGKNLPAEFDFLGRRMTNPGDEIPGGGYFSNAADISRFARMLCNRGELDGVRILSVPMVERMHRLETGEQINSFWNYSIGHRHWRPMPAEFTLGFFRRGEGTHPAGFGILASADTIGGYGAGTTCFWVDPVRRMTYAFLSAGFMEESCSLERHQRLSDLVFSALVRL